MTKDEFNIMIAEDLTYVTINEVTEDNEGEYIHVWLQLLLDKQTVLLP